MNIDESYIIPNNWLWTTIGEIAQSMQNGIYKPSQFYSDDGIACLRMYNIENGEIVWKDIKRMILTPEEIQQYKLEPNDILINRVNSRELVGKAAFISSGIEISVYESKNIRLRLFNNLTESKLIGYWFRSFSQKYYNQNAQQTVGMASINQEQISLMPIPLPPLNEQRRIVAKIEALKARSQRVKEELEDIPQLLDQFRQSVLAAAFRGDLTADWREQNSNVEPAEVLLKRIQEEFTHQNTKRYKSQDEFYPSLDKNFININFSKLPELWQLIEIRKICISSFYGPRFGKDEYVEDGIPSIRTTDMTDEGEIILQNPPKLNIPKDKLDDFKVLPGDLLVTRSGSIGVMAVFRGDYVAIPSAYLIRFRFSLMVSVDYIFYYLKSPIGQALLGLNSTSVTQSNINAEAIKNIPIPIPPLEEQQEIVSRIKSLLKVVNQIKQQYQETKANLDQLDQSILAKAFRGELVPQDPNDEPASVLLERIRAERAKLQTKTAKKSTLRLGSVTTTKTSARRTKKTQPQQEESVQLDLELE